MSKLALTQGYEAIVDEDMLKELSRFKWCIVRRVRSTVIHAMRKENGKTVFMHHAVIGKPPPGFVTDHINGDGLDNRRANLRFVTNRINTLNSSRSFGAKIIEKHGNRFRVRPFINGVRIDFGSFATEEEALNAVEFYRSKAWLLK